MDPDSPQQDAPEVAAAIPAIPAIPESSSQPMLTGRSVEEMHALKVLSIAAQEKLVQEKLEHLMELARKQGTIDRTAARLHLRIAPATATRYLTRLVNEGRLTRHREGDDVVYKVI